ncbi:MAG TPA: tetratricopeptide repeat protein [Planctomycetota bacterium]|nr:tetratricopeptide repeat protein [Planctomycetota bacterium]
MAQRLRNLHRPKDALEQIQRELEDDPKSVQALIELAWIRLDLDEHAPARQAAEAARELAPNNPYVLYVLAAIAGSTGKLISAREFLEQALDKEPNQDAFHSYHAAICLLLNLPKGAEASSKAALELDPEDAYGLEVRVRVLRASLREDQALEVARAGLALHPEHPLLLVHFGELSLAKNDATAAGNAFRSALRIDPALQSAKLGLIDALRARSVVYRWLSSFLRRSERFGRRCTTPRTKKIFLVYFLVVMVLNAITHQHWTSMLGLLPIGIGLYAGVLWFLLYLVVRFVVPIFLVRVFFDSLGKAAIKDTVTSWWKGPARGMRRAVLLGLVIGSPFFWPPMFGVIAVCLPFLVARKLPVGRSRRIGYGLAGTAVGLVVLGALWVWKTGFSDAAGMWFLAAVAVSLAILVQLVFENRRSAKLR